MISVVPTPTEPLWYALQVRTGREEGVLQGLREIEALASVFLPVWRGGLRPGQSRPTGRQKKRAERDAVLFPGYVFVQACWTPELRRQCVDVTDVVSFVGIPAGHASPIPGDQMRLVMELVELDYQPTIGLPPEKGRLAEVVSGPLEGTTGVIVWRNRELARIATTLSFLGERSLELLVPLSVLKVGEYHQPEGADQRRRSRGGRRAKRSRGVA
jgi:transcription antitermination factor NusG